MGFFDTLFGGAAEKDAAEKNRQAVAAYDQKAQDALKTGYASGTGSLNQAIGAYAPLSTLATDYNKGGALYLDALGINGPEAAARASGAFRTDPGYEGAIQAGLDVRNRRAGGSSMFNSGNAELDAQMFGQNLQDQQYQRWLQQVGATGQTGIGLATNVAQGQAGGYTNLANLARGYGEDVSGVAGNVLSGTTSANNLQAQGEASGAKNLLSAGLSLASLAMAPMTGGTSLAGLAGSAGKSLFGSTMGPSSAGSYFSPYYGPQAG